ncbi:MAG: spore germination protein [Lachnospiraceae bacterium]|nr:spore germination protein [Lachnospiraceae bacterium]MEE0960483.1 spore germination protein [Lachnospiraceae bacterium]
MMISSRIDENILYFDRELRLDTNFDIIRRDIEIGEKRASFYFIDGFIKDEVMQKLMDALFKITKDEWPTDIKTFIETKISYVEVEESEEVEDIIIQILSGVLCMFIDGYDKAIKLDVRTYPARGVEEPWKDKVMRGSRDGFVETLIFNTALIRRRIRDRELCVEMLNMGSSSKTDIAMCYMENRADLDLVKDLKERIMNTKVDALTMNQESLAECLFGGKMLNPFPKFKFSERPDTSAAALLDGNIIILVDNSPSAMILPTSVFDVIEEADEFYFPPVTGTYIRISRFVITFIALFLTPVWLLYTNNPQWLPDTLRFTLMKETVNVPVILQLLILELAIDGLRLAAINTPTSLSTPLSVTAGLVIGEFTVKSGWFNAETMLYMSFVALATYTQASFEFGYALKFMRIIMLLLTEIFSIYGLIAGIILTFATIIFNKTISGKSYIYPIYPWNKEKFIRKVLRVRLPHKRKE